jgi:uncharacterized Ntn-hydrolase superfamily protein
VHILSLSPAQNRASPTRLSLPSDARCLFGTFAIVGWDRHAGEVGVAVVSAVPAAGALTIFGRGGVGVACAMGLPNPFLALDALDMIEAGASATEAAAQLERDDPERTRHQLLAVDMRGEVGAFTGDDLTDWKGHFTRSGFAVAGNNLVGEAVLGKMIPAYEETDDILVLRLLNAIEAGQEEGGDRRGKVSAAVLIMRDQPYPYIDLRVDDHPNAVKELLRVWKSFRATVYPYLDALPRREPVRKE